MKKRLSAEGLFEQTRKRPLPRFPRRIALLTSPQGAAIHDFHRLLQDRVSIESIELFPVKVQGSESPAEIVAALRQVEERPRFDVLVLTRGGGSTEDLSAFNDESVVRALAECPVPTISAVGHEIDFTLCDFVADVRAATPSAAAALLGPSRSGLMEQLEGLGARLQGVFAAHLRSSRLQYVLLGERLGKRSPRRVLEEARQRLDDATLDLVRVGRSWHREKGLMLSTLATQLRRSLPLARFKPLRERLRDLSKGLALSLRSRVRDIQRSIGNASTRLEAYHPLSPLKRGYAVVTRARDGRILLDSQEAPAGEKLQIRLYRGSLDSTVDRSHPAKKEGRTRKSPRTRLS